MDNAWSVKMEASKTLTHGLAHVLNNKLAVIIGFAELASQVNREGQEITNELDHIMTAAWQARELVQELLLYCGSFEPRMQLVDLNQQVRGFAARQQSALLSLNSIDIQLSSGPNMLRVDPELLEKVLANLYTNATQAMASGGVLRITTDKTWLEGLPCTTCGKLLKGKWASLSITDNGHGIAPECLQRIFEPFYTTKEVGEGIGLGLSSALGITKAQGGHIMCESQLGVGTTFRIFLPTLAPQMTVEFPRSFGHPERLC